MEIKFKVSGTRADCWIGDNESDTFTITGPSDTVDAIARVLRGLRSGVEHDLSQRGARREPFVNDTTAAEREAEAKAKADAEAKALAASEAERLRGEQETIKAEIARLSALVAPAAEEPKAKPSKAKPEA